MAVPGQNACLKNHHPVVPGHNRGRPAMWRKVARRPEFQLASQLTCGGDVQHNAQPPGQCATLRMHGWKQANIVFRVRKRLKQPAMPPRLIRHQSRNPGNTLQHLCETQRCQPLRNSPLWITVAECPAIPRNVAATPARQLTPPPIQVQKFPLVACAVDDDVPERLGVNELAPARMDTQAAAP